MMMVMSSYGSAMKSLKCGLWESLNKFEEALSPIIGTDVFSDKHGNIYNLPDSAISTAKELFGKKKKSQQNRTTEDKYGDEQR